jgi:hypothetical protein
MFLTVHLRVECLTERLRVVSVRSCDSWIVLHFSAKSTLHEVTRSNAKQIQQMENVLILTRWVPALRA